MSKECAGKSLLIHETYQIKQFFLQRKYKYDFRKENGHFGNGPDN